ncbi:MULTISPECIES: FmdE family protein [Sulfurimonas]|uniref:FmdE family protein n=1 Tax=Sulfurimonas TaxID=202746 RepID=UPI0012642A01|nr:FmdE family protein [Sulfurimonas indica]
MHYPEFYDKVESIRLVDPLAKVLGAFENGEYEISYIEVVKAAGHSCPTVAGAYLMTAAALKALYSDKRAVRGNIKVEFAEVLEDGVAGVIGNVVSHITGATDKSGFKGLGGKFARHSLMHFSADINASGRFTRVDNNQSVDVIYNPSSIPADPEMMPLMQKMQSGAATPDDMKKFGQLWQDRVRRIFENKESVIEAKEL